MNNFSATPVGFLSLSDAFSQYRKGYFGGYDLFDFLYREQYLGADRPTMDRRTAALSAVAEWQVQAFMQALKAGGIGGLVAFERYANGELASISREFWGKETVPAETALITDGVMFGGLRPFIRESSFGTWLAASATRQVRSNARARGAAFPKPTLLLCGLLRDLIAEGTKTRQEADELAKKWRLPGHDWEGFIPLSGLPDSMLSWKEENALTMMGYEPRPAVSGNIVRNIDPGSPFLSFMDAALVLFSEVAGGDIAVANEAIDQAPAKLAAKLDAGFLTAFGKRHGIHEPMTGCWERASVYPDEVGGLIGLGSWLGEPGGDTLTVGSDANAQTWTNIRLRTEDVLSLLTPQTDADNVDQAMPTDAAKEKSLVLAPDVTGPFARAIIDAMAALWGGLPPPTLHFEHMSKAVWAEARRQTPELPLTAPARDTFDRARDAIRRHAEQS